MENPIKIHGFGGTPIFGNTHMFFVRVASNLPCPSPKGTIRKDMRSLPSASRHPVVPPPESRDSKGANEFQKIKGDL